MEAFRSGPRPPGSEARKANESRKSKIEKTLKEDNMEMAPGGPKKIIRPSQRPMKPEKEKAQSKSKIGRGKDIVKKDFRKEFNEKFDKPKTPEKQKKEGRIIGGNFYPKMAKGGRVGYKAGSKGCKLAIKGKGRAYGKNS